MTKPLMDFEAWKAKFPGQLCIIQFEPHLDGSDIEKL